MNAFKVVNEKLDNLARSMKKNTALILHEMRGIQFERLISSIDVVIEYFNRYSSGEEKAMERLLRNEYEHGHVKRSIKELRLSIGHYFQRYRQKTGFCVKLYDFEVDLMTKLHRAKLGLKLGCTKSRNDTCTLAYIEQDIEKIGEEMHDELNKCTVSFALDFTGNWLDDNIGGMVDTENVWRRIPDVDKKHAFIKSFYAKVFAKYFVAEDIWNFLKETFPQYDAMLLVYDPVGGFRRHCTNANFIRFR